MKHHNKFRVSEVEGGAYKIQFSELGPIGFPTLLAFEIDVRGFPQEVITLPTSEGYQQLLNAVYDEAYERGKNAVRVRMNEAMGFDGE